jgi:chemotaxis protein CheD
MCHFLLPSASAKPGEQRPTALRRRSLEAMVDKLLRRAPAVSEYIAHLYGGADTMPDGQRPEVQRRRAQHRTGLDA